MTSQQIRDAAEGNTRGIPTTPEEIAAFDRRKRIEACERAVVDAAERRIDALIAWEGKGTPRVEEWLALERATEAERKAVIAYREAKRGA